MVVVPKLPVEIWPADWGKMTLGPTRRLGVTKEGAVAGTRRGAPGGGAGEEAGWGGRVVGGGGGGGGRKGPGGTEAGVAGRGRVWRGEGRAKEADWRETLLGAASRVIWRKVLGVT